MIPARWRWRIGTALVLALAVGLVVWGANRPDDPELSPPSTTTRDTAPVDEAAGRSPIDGFAEIAFRVEPEGAEASTWCALLADSPALRQRGLVDQDDLRGYDGMVFRNDEPVTTTFTMRDTLIPLSVAFFDEDGAFVSARDMEPCPPGTDDCPSYAAEAPYLHALEVEQGALPSLGIGPGARLSFPDQPCPPPPGSGAAGASSAPGFLSHPGRRLSPMWTRPTMTASFHPAPDRGPACVGGSGGR